MKYLKNAFELYISSSIHVSLAVVAFTIVTFLENNVALNLKFIGFIFFATITGYNFVKYSGIAQLHHLSLTKNLRLIQIFSLLSFIVLIYFALQLDLRTIIATAILGLFTMFYSIPVFGKNKNLRSLSGLKIFIIAVVWAGSTVILPLIASEKFLELEIVVDFIQRLMLVIAITLPFEIRDLKFDERNLGTIPQQLGVFKTKIFGTVLLALIFIIELFQNSFNSVEFFALLLMLCVSGIMIWKSNRNQAKYYASFWVEALPIIYLGTLLIFRHYL